MKRGSSGLSLVVGVDKPQGLSSHDAVNRARRIFGERRVGHTGTLDPLATGVLPLCIGPATRLDKYLTGHEKAYRATMCFGFETTTDDSMGEPTAMGSVPESLDDPAFAASYVAGIVGEHLQTPPQYSAVKIDGRKAYEVARAGGQTSIPARSIRVFEAELLSIGKHPEAGLTTWEFEVRVSKGTYIRSLVRDMGRDLDCPAHLMGLRRTASGNIGIDDCVSIETLERLGTEAAIDPVRALGLRYAFCDDVARFVDSGNKLFEAQVKLYEMPEASEEQRLCSCMGGAMESESAPRDAELVSIIVGNRLKAIYRYEARSNSYRPDCVFSVPVARV